jgi:hypothetical protein
MPSKKSKYKKYLAMWDKLGLECLFDVDAELHKLNIWEKDRTFSILKEEPHSRKPDGIPLQMMILRARYNSHRQYEIYEFSSTLPVEEIKKVFEMNPQPLVNWIRENGGKIYSDYERSSKWLIQ